MSETKRDPRVDPRPGDELRKKYQGQYFESRGYMDRRVDDVDSGIIHYTSEGTCVVSIEMASWRRWAKTAEVIHAAE